MISFNNVPLLLFLLPVYFLLAFWRWRKSRREKSHASLLISNSFFSEINPGWRAKVTPIFEISRWLALLLLIFSLGEPRFNLVEKELFAKGIDIVIALDVSASMDAVDILPNRLNSAKKSIKQFIEKRKYDRIGLVLFGKGANLQCPITLDHTLLNYFLDKLYLSDEVRTQTAIGTAITTSLLALNVDKEDVLDSKNKIIILVTDGENTGGQIDPLTASEIAKSLGIKIYTVGIGKPGRSHIFRTLNDSFLGQSTPPVETIMNEKALKQIAAISKGKYYNTQTAISMEKTFSEIDQLEKKNIALDGEFEFRELHLFFISAAFVLFLLEVFGKILIFRILPY